MVNIDIVHSKLAAPLLPQLLQEIEFYPICVRNFQLRKPPTHCRASLHNKIVSRFIYFICCDVLFSLFLGRFNLRFPTIFRLQTPMSTISKLLVTFKGAITIKHWQTETSRILILRFRAAFQNAVHTTFSFDFCISHGLQRILSRHIDC